MNRPVPTPRATDTSRAADPVISVRGLGKTYATGFVALRDNRCIILMHVGSDGTDQDALPGLVEAFREDGYAFVTVEEILQP